MKVLHLGKFYPPAKGGMETILELLCDRTAGLVENRVLVANDKWATSEERRGRVEVIRVPALVKIGAVAVAPTLPLRLAREQADLIVIHEPNPMALLAYFLARPAGTLVVWFHSEVIRPSWRYRIFYRPFLQFAFERASRIIVASPTLATSAPQLREWQAKCVVIPYGIEPRAARGAGAPQTSGGERGEGPPRLSNEPRAARGEGPPRLTIDADHQSPSQSIAKRAEALRKQHNQPVVLFVGRLVPYKGIDVLLEAMRGVPAVAVLVGEGLQRAALERKAEALGVADRITFAGEVSDDELAALYQACDMVVLPSVTRQEAFGIVQIEAMACGKPVISTDLGTGVAWVNQHSETGLIVPPRDAAALRAAIQQLLANPVLRATLGDAGARRARSVFAVDRMIDATLALYRDVSGVRDKGQGAKITPNARPFTPCPLPLTPYCLPLFPAVAKRALDLLLSASGLILSAPLWLLIACGIKLEDRGPIFFHQERVGEGGGRFRALKFRSMITDAESRTGPVQSGNDDPRVTRVGRVLRATAMDELPQLWNIFRGDMSFVGPRALRPDEIEVNGQGTLERLEDVPGFGQRCAVRPGLTGVAQIYAPRDLVRRHKFRYDKLYIRRQSVWLDVRLILLSFWITFRGTWETRGRKF